MYKIRESRSAPITRNQMCRSRGRNHFPAYLERLQLHIHRRCRHLRRTHHPLEPCQHTSLQPLLNSRHAHDKLPVHRFEPGGAYYECLWPPESARKRQTHAKARAHPNPGVHSQLDPWRRLQYDPHARGKNGRHQKDGAR